MLLGAASIPAVRGRAAQLSCPQGDPSLCSVPAVPTLCSERVDCSGLGLLPTTLTSQAGLECGFQLGSHR